LISAEADRKYIAVIQHTPETTQTKAIKYISNRKVKVNRPSRVNWMENQ
jgi:hypothetical protein